MINEGTWFYFKGPEALKEIVFGKEDVTTLDYCARAKQIVDYDIQRQIAKFYQFQELSNIEKDQMTNGIVSSFVEDLNHDTTLNANLLINEGELSIVKEFVHNFLFPMENPLTYVDFELLIKCLLDSKNETDLFYVDTYSIYKIAEMFYHLKSMFSHFENKYPSESERKSTYRSITKVKDTLLLTQEESGHELLHNQKFYAEFIGKFIKSDKEKLLFKSTHSSPTKSPKPLLKLIPSRIITKKEVNDKGSITFKRNKAKNAVLFDLLKVFYPEKHNYYSQEEYPLNTTTVYDKYVDATVKRKFY